MPNPSPFILGLTRAHITPSPQQAGNCCFHAFPLARVWLNQDMKVDPVLLGVEKELSGARYRLLLQGSDHLYLFQPVGFSEPSLLVMPLSQVSGWRLVPRNPQYQ